MADEVPTYRRHLSTSLALGGNQRPRSSENDRDARLFAADEVSASAEEPLLSPEGDQPFVLPVDRYSFVKNVFFLLGIVVLLPWNFLATASDVPGNPEALPRTFGGYQSFPSFFGRPWT